MAELLPRLKSLLLLAKHYNMGLNIDAEEGERLDLSLDLLEVLVFDPDLSDWDDIGFVVQAYQKRCSCVVDWLIDLALEQASYHDSPSKGRVLGCGDQACTSRGTGRLSGLDFDGVRLD